MIKYMYIAPGQSFDVNRSSMSFWSYVASFKSQTTIVSEKFIVLPFSHTKAYGTKFDLVVKKVKVKPGSSFV